jgi:hypothetical protein
MPSAVSALMRPTCTGQLIALLSHQTVLLVNPPPILSFYNLALTVPSTTEPTPSCPLLSVLPTGIPLALPTPHSSLAAAADSTQARSAVSRPAGCQLAAIASAALAAVAAAAAAPVQAAAAAVTMAAVAAAAVAARVRAAAAAAATAASVR